MNIKRFTAPTSREALAKARMAFGDGTLILSNRPTANGVEVVATAEDTLSALDGGGAGNTSSAPLLAPSAPRNSTQPARSPVSAAMKASMALDLEPLRERLAAVHGDSARLELESGPTITLDITLPFQTDQSTHC